MQVIQDMVEPPFLVLVCSLHIMVIKGAQGVQQNDRVRVTLFLRLSTESEADELALAVGTCQGAGRVLEPTGARVSRMGLFDIDPSPSSKLAPSPK